MYSRITFFQDNEFSCTVLAVPDAAPSLRDVVANGVAYRCTDTAPYVRTVLSKTLLLMFLRWTQKDGSDTELTHH
jgi:hypothetical protein